MLTRISLKAGSSPTKAGLEFELSPVTIFVGPNNSGKSRALMEIEGWVTRGQPPSGHVIQKVEFEPWDSATFEGEIEKIEVAPNRRRGVGVRNLIGNPNLASRTPFRESRDAGAGQINEGLCKLESTIEFSQVAYWLL